MDNSSLKVPKIVNLQLAVRQVNSIVVEDFVSVFEKLERRKVEITIGSETNMHKKWPGFTSSRIPGDFCI